MNLCMPPKKKKKTFTYLYWSGDVILYDKDVICVTSKERIERKKKCDVSIWATQAMSGPSFRLLSDRPAFALLWSSLVSLSLSLSGRRGAAPRRLGRQQQTARRPDSQHPSRSSRSIAVSLCSIAVLLQSRRAAYPPISSWLIFISLLTAVSIVV